MFRSNNGLIINGFDRRCGRAEDLALGKGATTANWRSINYPGYPFNKDSKVLTLLDGDEPSKVSFGMILANNTSSAKEGSLFARGVAIETFDDRIALLEFFKKGARGSRLNEINSELNGLKRSAASLGGKSPVWVVVALNGELYTSSLGVVTHGAEDVPEEVVKILKASLSKYFDTHNLKISALANLTKYFNLTRVSTSLSGISSKPLTKKNVSRLVSLLGVIAQIKSMNGVYGWAELAHDNMQVLDSITQSSLKNEELTPNDLAFSFSSILDEASLSAEDKAVLNEFIGIPFCKASLLSSDGMGELQHKGIISLLSDSTLSVSSTASSLTFSRNGSFVTFSGDTRKGLVALRTLDVAKVQSVMDEILSYAKLVGTLDGGSDVWALSLYLRWIGIQGITASTFVSGV